MKATVIILRILALSFAVKLMIQPVLAQGYGGELTFQGIDRQILPSAAARAMGGVSIGSEQDIGLMFQNPATLHAIRGFHISLGGFNVSNDLSQEQHYAPVRYYPNLSLLLEGLTALIPDPDPLLFGFTAQDSVQRPFDNIGPNWSRSGDFTKPIHAMAAMPLSSGPLKIVAGIGAVRVAQLNHYYQNNNVLSPSILAQRPLPTFRPTDDAPVEVAWSQSIRSRQGSIQGYGASLVGYIESLDLAIGLSGRIWQGSSDDHEHETGRGRLTFFSNAFRADSLKRTVSRTGTSDFTGSEFTISSMLTGRYARMGFALKVPTTITRKYTLTVDTDTSGVANVSDIADEDKMKLPWRGLVGLALTPRADLTLGLEYEFRPFQSARYTASNGMETSPWLSVSLFRIGLSYQVEPWLTLRSGMRGESEVFQAEGNHLEGEPVKYTTYSAGIGLSYSGLKLNLAYENSRLRYQDIWSSAISQNKERRHTLVAQLSYALPWVR